MKPQIIITLEQGPKITVNGPLDDEIICLYMLEKAKDAVKAHNTRKRAGIVKPVIMPAPTKGA